MLMMAIPSPDLVSLAVQAGMGTVILDMEHGYPGLSEVREAIPASRLPGGKCMVRLAQSMVSLVGPLADLDVDGLLLSGSRAISEVETFISLARFPPTGRRSLNPFVQAAAVPGSIEVLSQRTDDLRLWVMAETESLLADLRARGPVPINGLDGILIGPYDLAADLGVQPSPSEPRLVEAVKSFAHWAESADADWALFVRDSANLDAWQELGIRPASVVLGYDRDLWFTAVRDRVNGRLRSNQTPP